MLDAFIPKNPVELVILAAAALALIMAFLSLGNMIRAAGFLVLSVSIAMVAVWIKETGNMTVLIAALIGGGLALGFMNSSSKGSDDDDLKKPG